MRLYWWLLRLICRVRGHSLVFSHSRRPFVGIVYCTRCHRLND